MGSNCWWCQISYLSLLHLEGEAAVASNHKGNLCWGVFTVRMMKFWKNFFGEVVTELPDLMLKFALF